MSAPTVEALTRRLIETPSDFVAPAVIGGRGVVDAAAVVSDLLVDLGGASLDAATAAMFRPLTEAPGDRNWLGAVLVSTWLLHDDELAAAVDVDRVLPFLTTDARDLAAVVPAPAFITDPDRREELARRCLAAMGVVPAGETEAQAADRLAALDSVERVRVLAATQEAERRAAEVRKALHSKRAAEAAAKASRE